MVRAEFFNQQHAIQVVSIRRWLSVSSAVAALIGLSILNGMHSPAYDCVRAGAYLLRSRRSGPYVPMVQIENSPARASSVVRMPLLLTATHKESFYVRD